MNKSPTKWLKKTYRREPVSAFILTFGLMETVLGGFGARWTLLSFGVSIVVISLLMRWLQVQNKSKRAIIRPSRLYLPPQREDLIPLPPLKRKRDYRF